MSRTCGPHGMSSGQFIAPDARVRAGPPSTLIPMHRTCHLTNSGSRVLCSSPTAPGHARHQLLWDSYHSQKHQVRKASFLLIPLCGDLDTWNSQSFPPPASKGAAVSQPELPCLTGPVRQLPPMLAGPCSGGQLTQPLHSPSMVSPAHWASGHDVGAEDAALPPSSEPCFTLRECQLPRKGPDLHFWR